MRSVPWFVQFTSGDVAGLRAHADGRLEVAGRDGAVLVTARLSLPERRELVHALGGFPRAAVDHESSGRKGGLATLATRGKDHYRRAGLKSAAARKRRE